MVQFIESLKISTSPYINAALSIVAFIIVAKAVDLFIDKVLRRFVRFTKTDVDDRIIDIIHRPVYFTIILFGCILAVIYLHPSPEVILMYRGSSTWAELTATASSRRASVSSVAPGAYTG